MPFTYIHVIILLVMCRENVDMEIERLKEIIFINLIYSLGDYVKAVKEDPTDVELLEYCEGIIFGQLKMALDLKFISSDDLSNVYHSIMEYKNKIIQGI